MAYKKKQVYPRRGRPYKGRGRGPVKQTLKPEADGRLKKVFSKIGVPKKGEFKPDPFQVEAVETVKEFDCLVTAPTGSGKTWIAVEAISHVLKQGGRSWYASPLKALSNSKFIEFSGIFGPENVGILTGDRKENTDAPIIVGTTEILRNQLYDCMHMGHDLSSDFVVLDEAHYLGDEQRGVVWEETIIYLPVRVPLLLLSATIGNADQIAAWLTSIRDRECKVVAETKRPVPLFSLFLHPSGRLMPFLASPKSRSMDKKVRDSMSGRRPPKMPMEKGLPPMGQILKVLGKYDLLPAIFFLKSRKDCDIALTLCEKVLKDNPARRREVRSRMLELVHEHPYLAGHRQRRFIEQAAVGSHHSGQLPAWKLLIESLMTEGLLDAVFATSTVAAGVNFPARSVVFFNSDRFNGKEFDPLTPTQYHQMTGRAGRRGMDAIGFSIAAPGKFMDLDHVARVNNAPTDPVDSRIRMDFSMVLNLLLSHTPEDVRRLLHRSFASFQAADRFGDPAMAVEVGEELWEDFMAHMYFLIKEGYVSEEHELTRDGLWASGLRVDQPLVIAHCFRSGLFEGMEPALLAAMIAVFVQDKDLDVYLDDRALPKKLLNKFTQLVRTVSPLFAGLIEAGFETRPVQLWPAAAIHAWATGNTWEFTKSVAGMSDGDLAMLVLRTAENLRQVKNLREVFPQTAEAAAQAIEAIKRPPVVEE
ncbi:Helicase conserved C-terminal domain-containing protein [Desulfatibacillum alkenivorans DSM 16219]|jgi:superfamily II RNA helicase|uniref:Helicase conserved C-terminal domain-containing protein n=1 Tax=Desulfatibacillum alkenivorans DSM 16219 TaxID=1121393 RepID=A0A1M6YDR9_9BACT|nr:DEAD/DEAH box helicase [Desulfatibacillum alkenivorans]SHL16292.1 Helicase conserved C-terminal domain-containing protein [Desulfatibacillum alkenivorans DSM 16219]